VNGTLPTSRDASTTTRRSPEPVELLRLSDVVATYRGGAIRALDGVTLSVERGAIVALLGANGAGKTTVIRTITGLLGMSGGKLNSGSVHFDGRRIDGMGPSARVALGLSQVMEGRRIFADLTVDENLQAGAFAVRDKKRRKESYERVLALFPPLADMRSRVAGYLSGGEQQMLAIGRALMQSPKLLLLDEPSLGLAPLIVRRVRETLREINAGGTSILLVEQNTAMALSISDRAYVLEQGRVELSGPSQQLRQDASIAALYLGGSASEEVSLAT
jgi:ABC-type branched-subunit amino acid transport system ATPase component